MLANGLVFMTQGGVNDAAAEAGLEPAVAELVMRELDGQGFLEYDGQLVQGGLP